MVCATALCAMCVCVCVRTLNNEQINSLRVGATVQSLPVCVCVCVCVVGESLIARQSLGESVCLTADIHSH